MRFSAVIMLFATCCFAGFDGYSQDVCSARAGASQRPGERPPTFSENAHRALLTTPRSEWRNLSFGDVQLILKCGTVQEAAELFAVLRDRSVERAELTVVEAGPDFVRVSWDDGFEPHLAAFRFSFAEPVSSPPRPGEKIGIRGTYSSYSREPFQVNLTNASTFVLPHPGLVYPKDR